MMLLAVTGYFLLVVGLLCLLFFPAQRNALSARLGAGVRQLAHGGSTGAGALFAALRRGIDSTRQRGRGTIAWLRRHRLQSAAVLLAVSAPSILALSLQQRALFELDDAPRAMDRHIALLLEGEQLAPPPALPPEAFTTREVTLMRPTAAWASRNWDLLDDEFRQRLLMIFKLMRERHGYELVLLEGYRSPERQASLAAQGDHVTRAGANMSYHQYGLAADIAFWRDGKVVISELDPWAMRGYGLYGEIAEELGMTWGGRWQMRDYGHVELRRPGVLGSARR
ncbi:M15 family metallopeptidase [Pseudothauera lacus]|uniref:D-alanyl-D-alanine carboxypeptidase n=1 Tax=Pseudothauera lacus TaxID=2136175 RepID=A0A2T4IDP9_9RHOO|nr:M15 family metallopeptidase [Pseudothauera lacus]PTD95897.1 D-alanyl-D-alanine carboxypeptidase [Pseudothauera lacus]